MNGWKDEWVKGRMYERMKKWVMEGCMNGWKDGWVKGRMYEWMERWMGERKDV